MNDNWFSYVCEHVRRDTGVRIDADKQYFAESRLTPLLSKFQIADFSSLPLHMANRKNPELTGCVVEAMMVGETSFFRDLSVFDHFRSHILPEVVARNSDTRELRIWCAACSSGQEPYTVAMILDDWQDKLRGWRVDLMATDVSANAVNKAAAGSYNQFEVQRGLPVTMLLRHFSRHAERWRIAEHLRSRIEFKTANLLDAPDLDSPADIIFCRNVLMYFDLDVRKAALNKLSRSLAPGGRLILGATETAASHNAELSNTKEYPAIFKKSEDLQARPFETPVQGLETSKIAKEHSR